MSSDESLEQNVTENESPYNPCVELHAVLDDAPLTPAHWKIWFLCAMGIFIDGFDLFVIAVAMPLIAQDVTSDKWLLGLIGAAAPLGAMVGAATLGPITDKIGRKMMYMIDLSIFILFSALCLFAWNAWSLIIFRFLLGIGIGADYPISSSYIAEFMPAKLRGKLLAGAFSFQALGSIAGAILGLAVLNIVPDVVSWRIMLGAGIIPAALIMVLRHAAPESPRWLFHHGKPTEAWSVVESVVGAERMPPPMSLAQAEPATAAAVDPPKSTASPTILLTRPYWRRTCLALIPWFLLDVALYAVGTFTPTVIAAMETDKGMAHNVARSFIHKDMVATEGAVFLDLFLIVGFLLSIFLVEKVGRIKLQMVGFCGMSVGLVILAYAGALPSSTFSFWLIFVGFAVFNLLVNMGPNATTYLLAAELFPTNLRATGHGMASAAGKVGAVIGIFFLPVAIASYGLSTTMAFVAGAGILGFIVTWIFGIETAGASLEEIA